MNGIHSLCVKLDELIASSIPQRLHTQNNIKTQDDFELAQHTFSGWFAWRPGSQIHELSKSMNWARKNCWWTQWSLISYSFWLLFGACIHSHRHSKVNIINKFGGRRMPAGDHILDNVFVRLFLMNKKEVERWLKNHDEFQWARVQFTFHVPCGLQFI